ncbi:translation initiation factor eIF-2B subunit delta [Neodiprion virginianus]|uniref:translation initiation factor eIF-2B subunit delta n=1 Tax=Neodiprion virginianus TaxID=2961670 RepID=UPI001EE6F58A|nr:translation initiation factor eIF-2B subunit delta [Neodiprion virginianus]
MFCNKFSTYCRWNISGGANARRFSVVTPKPIKATVFIFFSQRPRSSSVDACECGQTYAQSLRYNRKNFILPKSHEFVLTSIVNQDGHYLYPSLTIDKVTMEQQSTEEAKQQVSRSKARHLRRKRLIAARKSANDSSSLSHLDTEQNIIIEGTDVLTKSKAKRLRKKKKAKLAKDPSQALQTDKDTLESEIESELSINNISLSDVSGYEKFNQSAVTNYNKPNFLLSELKKQASKAVLDDACKSTSRGSSTPSIYEKTCTSNTVSNDQSLNKKQNINKSESPGHCQNLPHSDFEISPEGHSDISTDLANGQISVKSEGKINLMMEKSREQVKAEREAKKAAKALAKSKAKTPKTKQTIDVKNSQDTQTKIVPADAIEKGVKEFVVDKDAVPPKEILKRTESEIVSSASDKKNELVTKATGEKCKREARAERRAKQEAQRAAKEMQMAPKNKQKTVEPPKLKASRDLLEPVKNIVKKNQSDSHLHEVKLFKHLYRERQSPLVNVPTLNSSIHPALIRLGVQYANKIIVGSNARCVALLSAIKQLINDFERPPQVDFTRGLEASLQESAAYLHRCRPIAVSMQNALKHLKWQMSQLSTTISDEDAKTKLQDAIDTYIREQIELAGKAISDTIKSKISNGDVILTYAFSSLIHNILVEAHKDRKQFRVIIVDGRPWLEGKEQMRRLVRHGIECSYVLINALSFIMPEVSKVFLGAHAILANGAVMSRAGTAQVALMAKAFNVPVLVACETHKSCERVQTDSFVYNEIGDADELAYHWSNNAKKSVLTNWKTKKSLDLLNITFDVTPADLVSAVVTELAILPCTSIPVILRIKPSEI